MRYAEPVAVEFANRLKTVGEQLGTNTTREEKLGEAQNRA